MNATTHCLRALILAQLELKRCIDGGNSGAKDLGSAGCGNPAVVSRGAAAEVCYSSTRSRRTPAVEATQHRVLLVYAGTMLVFFRLLCPGILEIHKRATKGHFNLLHLISTDLLLLILKSFLIFSSSSVFRPTLSELLTSGERHSEPGVARKRIIRLLYKTPIRTSSAQSLLNDSEYRHTRYRKVEGFSPEWRWCRAFSGRALRISVDVVPPIILK
jgi:hypothetical protein